MDLGLRTTIRSIAVTKNDDKESARRFDPPPECEVVNFSESWTPSDLAMEQQATSPIEIRNKVVSYEATRAGTMLEKYW